MNWIVLGAIAIGSSLAIVGAISLIGSLPYAYARQIDWRSVIWFGVPGLLGAWLAALAAHGSSMAVAGHRFNAAAGARSPPPHR